MDNAFGGNVARFPANDPSKVEVLSTGGHSAKRMALDSKAMFGSLTRWDRSPSLETEARLLLGKLEGKSLQGMDELALRICCLIPDWDASRCWGRTADLVRRCPIGGACPKPAIQPTIYLALCTDVGGNVSLRSAGARVDTRLSSRRPGPGGRNPRMLPLLMIDI